MPKITLTDSVVKSLKSATGQNATIYFDSATPGLSLVVSAHGTKSWTARFRADERQQRLTIGKYPAVSLRAARDAMYGIRVDLSKGRNPAADKRQHRQHRREAIRVKTIEALTERYFEAAAAGRHKRNAKRALSAASLTNHRYAADLINPRIGGTVISDLKRAEVEDLIVEVENQRGIGAAKAVRDLLSSLFSYAMHREIVDSNPVLAVYTPRYEARDRVITDGELRQLIANVRGSRAAASRAVRIAIELCALTLARASEVAGIRLSELDLSNRVWTIPAIRTKARRQHEIPLSGQATDLIREAIAIADEVQRGSGPNSGGVDRPLFPSPRDTSIPIEGHALTRAFARLRTPLPDDPPSKQDVSLVDIRLHDLRRTGATGLAQLGFSGEIISRVLNHTPASGAAVTAIYNRHRYMAEKGTALNAWAMRFTEIVEGKKQPTNVIKISGN